MASIVPSTPPINVPIGDSWLELESHHRPSQTQAPMLPAMENAMPENLKKEGDLRDFGDLR
tara:strand:+ start:1241 stop:1423 length:183 start_codon:yes stop_codon:yes gene_type:complete